MVRFLPPAPAAGDPNAHGLLAPPGRDGRSFESLGRVTLHATATKTRAATAAPTAIVAVRASE